jgi:HSP20 family molecular chaperone IbpA
MWTVNIRNNSFNRFGSEFATLIDKNHFLGHSSLKESWFKNKDNSDRQPFKEHQYHFSIPVEGYAKEELYIELSCKYLIIRGLKEIPQHVENNFLTLIEKNSSFEQVYELREMVNQDEIQAVYEDEVLSLTFTSHHRDGEGVRLEKINIL